MGILTSQLRKKILLQAKIEMGKVYLYKLWSMSTKYKFADNTAVYFTTSTITDWTDVFTRQLYKTILLDSIRHCQQKQGLLIHAWFLMTNQPITCIPSAVVKRGKTWALSGVI